MYNDLRSDPPSHARGVPGGRASFGTVLFPFRRATCLHDEKVIVELEATVAPRAVVDLFEAAAQHGTSQLCLGSTLCRAKPVGWELEARRLVFELQRADVG